MLLFILFFFSIQGCHGYAGKTESFRSAIDANETEIALENIEELVAIAEGGRNRYQADLPLYLMERAALFQALQDHQSAIADLNDADQMLEILDLTSDQAGETAEYLWSDSTSLYRAPIYEKLMINIMAIASYLAINQTNSAQVEARRISVLTDYYRQTTQGNHPMLGSALYFAGLAMELGGSEQEANRFYTDAEAFGVTSQLRQTSERELIIITFSGLPPRRESVVIPIATAYQWSLYSDCNYSDQQRQQLNRFMAENLLTTVNFPTLVVPTQSNIPITTRIDGVIQPTFRLANISQYAIESWEASRAQIAWAAITRALVRVLVREAIQATGEILEDSQDQPSLIAEIFFLISLIAQGSMAAIDVPDTRTWTLMPANIHITRVPIEVGEHVVSIYGSSEETFSINISEHGTNVITVHFFQ